MKVLIAFAVLIVCIVAHKPKNCIDPKAEFNGMTFEQVMVKCSKDTNGVVTADVAACAVETFKLTPENFDKYLEIMTPPKLLEKIKRKAEKCKTPEAVNGPCVLNELQNMCTEAEENWAD